MIPLPAPAEIGEPTCEASRASDGVFLSRTTMTGLMNMEFVRHHRDHIRNQERPTTHTAGSAECECPMSS